MQHFNITVTGRTMMFPAKKIFFVICIVFFVVFCSVTSSEAWLVTVKNDTEYLVSVRLYVNFIVNGLHEEVTICAGGSHTFDTGGLCPSGFTGTIYHRYASSLAETSILGHEVGISGFSAGCWNSAWKVCRKRGSGHVTETRDYGFCKQ